MTTNLYRSGSGWVFDNKITPAGTIRIDISQNPVVSFYYASNGVNVFDRAFNVSDILDANGVPYADFNTFISAVSDFFVNAPFSGGYPVVESAVSGTNNVALQFCKAILQTNPLVSTDILTLTLAQTTSTKIGEYIYSFTTGATAPTITWPIECKESIVISPNKKYLISFVRVSATKVFTFIDEEVL